MISLSHQSQVAKRYRTTISDPVVPVNTDLIGTESIIDTDNHECMTLRSTETPDNAHLEKLEKHLVDWYSFIPNQQTRTSKKDF